MCVYLYRTAAQVLWHFLAQDRGKLRPRVTWHGWRRSCASAGHQLAGVPALTSRGELGGPPAQAGGPRCVALARWRAGWVLGAATVPLAEADPPADGSGCIEVAPTRNCSRQPHLTDARVPARPRGRRHGATARRRRRIRQLPGACASLHRRRVTPAALAAVLVQVDTSSTRRRLQQMCIW